MSANRFTYLLFYRYFSMIRYGVSIGYPSLLSNTYCLVLSRLNHCYGAFIQQLKNRCTETSVFIMHAFMHIYKDVK